MYWCEMGDVIGSIYYLHIDDNFEELDTYPNTTDLEAVSTNISKYDIKIYTTWTTWTPCSMCNAVGIKLRYGYCTISSLGSLVYKYTINANPSTQDELQKKQNIKDKGK